MRSGERVVQGRVQVRAARGKVRVGARAGRELRAAGRSCLAARSQLAPRCPRSITSSHTPPASRTDGRLRPAPPPPAAVRARPGGPGDPERARLLAHGRCVRVSPPPPYLAQPLDGPPACQPHRELAKGTSGTLPVPRGRCSMAVSLLKDSRSREQGVVFIAAGSRSMPSSANTLASPPLPAPARSRARPAAPALIFSRAHG